MAEPHARAHAGMLVDRLRPTQGGPGDRPARDARSLLALPLIVVLPVLVFAVAAFSYLTGERQRALENGIVQTARHAIQTSDLLLQERISTLQALASLVTDRDLDAFSRQSALLLRSRPDWIRTTIRDAEGRLLASEGRPGGPEPEHLAEGSLDAGAGLVALVARGTEGRPHLRVRLLVGGEGRHAFFVSAKLDLEPFSRALAGLAGPDWTLAVLDPQGVIAGRSRDPSAVGRQATPSLQAAIDAGGERLFYAYNQEGERTYTAISASSRSGWTSAVGAPAALVEAPLRRARLAWIVGGLAAIGLAGILASLLTHNLLRRSAAERKAWQLESARETDARLAEIARHFPGVMYRRVLHPDDRVSHPFVSDGIAALLGEDPGTLAQPRDLDRLARELVLEEDRPAARAAILASARDLTPLDIELRIRRRDGSTAWVRSAAAAHRGADGSIVWDGIVTDITHLKATESALKARTEALRTVSRVNTRIASELDGDSLVQAVLDAGRDMIKAAYGAFFYEAQNEGGELLTLYKLSGARPEDFAGFPMPRGTKIFGPTLRGEQIIRLDDVTSAPEYGQNPPYHGMPQGHLPVRSYLAAPVISRSGEVLGGLFFGHPEPGVFDENAEEIVSGIAAQAAVAMENARLFRAAEDEIARRRAIEERQGMLLAELNHRVKNTLAVVLAIAQQTARTSDSVGQFGEAFRGRIMALASAHSLLTAGEWRSTTLRALVAGALEPYGEVGGRARIAGPEVVVAPKQALALGLVFHELATNASKYGALSPAGGELRVDWYDDGEGVLALDWHESLPTPIESPRREGFGSKLITMNLERELNGSIARHFTPGGLRATMRLPWNAETLELAPGPDGHHSTPVARLA